MFWGLSQFLWPKQLLVRKLGKGAVRTSTSFSSVLVHPLIYYNNAHRAPTYLTFLISFERGLTHPCLLSPSNFILYTKYTSAIAEKVLLGVLTSTIGLLLNPFYHWNMAPMEPMLTQKNFTSLSGHDPPNHWLDCGSILNLVHQSGLAKNGPHVQTQGLRIQWTLFVQGW